MDTSIRLAGPSIFSFFVCVSFDIHPANAAFLTIQFTDSVANSVTQTGFTAWDFSAYNTTPGAGPASTTYTSSDPGVSGGSGTLYLSQPTVQSSPNTFNGNVF
jgi:hypothetical protein